MKQPQFICSCMYGISRLYVFHGKILRIKMSPCLCFPPCSTVWHCAQALVKIFLPLSADILEGM